MRKRTILAGLVALAASGAAWSSYSKSEAAGNGRGSGPIVYVQSQGLFFDSILTADSLPPQGDFQLLEMGPNGLETAYGPGDPGYRGGRWKADFDGDGVFVYFSCPLLGPGRVAP
jgi:hypothetical protein